MIAKIARRRTFGLVTTLLLAACSRPGTPREPCSDTRPLGTICGFENPEDIAYVASRNVVLVSQMRRQGRGGSIAGLSEHLVHAAWPGGEEDFTPDPAFGDRSCPPPLAEKFSPHGMFILADSRAYIVNHGGRESIEIFSIARGFYKTRLSWLGCVLLPAGTAGNDVVVAPDGEVFVSNFAPELESLWSSVRIGLGWVTGDVLAWRPETGWRHVPGTQASGANGVALSSDGQNLFYSETGGGRLVRVARDGSGRREVKIPGLPDNLSWSSRGTLYLPAHESGLALLRCTGALPCHSPWRLFEIDPDSLEIKEVLRHDGSLIGGVSSAAARESGAYLGAAFGDRIGVWGGP